MSTVHNAPVGICVECENKHKLSYAKRELHNTKVGELFTYEYDCIPCGRKTRHIRSQ